MTPTSRSTRSAAPTSATSWSSRRTSPTPRTIMLEQNYRSTQTILTAANAVISRNKGRKPKNLWSDAGDGEQIVGYVARRRARRGAVRRRGDRPAHRRGRRAARRRRGVLPHQRPVPGVRGGVHPRRHALQGRRRGAVLRAARGQGRAGLPADPGQPRRRGLAAPDPQRAQARHRRPGRGLRRGARAAASGSRFFEALRRAAGRARHRDPVADRHPAASSTWSSSSSRWSTRGSAPTWCSSRCSRAAATSRSSRSPTTRRTRPGWRTSPSWSRWPASSPTSPSSGPSADPADEDAAPSPGLSDFLERVALVADSDQIPDQPRTTRRAWSR